MTTVEKTVRFYDAVVVDDQDVRRGVKADFWSGVIRVFGARNFAARSAKIGDVDYFGRAVSPRRPALPHLQVERVRDLAEQLNISNLSNGSVLPLDFTDPNDRVSEPTFIVPFGRIGRVAVMSPAVQATRPETLGRWLTSVLGLVPLGFSLELVPVVDPDVLSKIQNADGAVMLEVHVDSGAQIPATGGGAVGDAFRDAQKQALQDARITLRWSLDRAGGNASIRSVLRAGAAWVARSGFSSNASVKLATLDAQGKLIRDEVRAIFEDRITAEVTFQATAGTRATDEAILNAIGEAIRRFSSSGAPRAVAGITGTQQITI